MSKKKTAVVMGGTKEFAFAMGTFLLSVLDKSGLFFDECVIFHNGISIEEQTSIHQIAPTRFIHYQCPFSDLSRFSKTVEGLYSPMVFSKLECLKLLKDYRTVIWFDYDMVAGYDLSELAIAVSGGVKMILVPRLEEHFHRPLHHPQLETYANIHGMHAGVFALHDTIGDYEAMYQYCVDMGNRYAEDLYLPEQILFALMLHEFQLPVYPLPFQLFSPHPTQKGKVWDPYVRLWHAYGADKFWNTLPNPDWNAYHNRWLQILHGKGDAI